VCRSKVPVRRITVPVRRIAVRIRKIAVLVRTVGVLIRTLGVLVRMVGLPVRRIKGHANRITVADYSGGSRGFAQKVFGRPTPKAIANLARRNTPGSEAQRMQTYIGQFRTLKGLNTRRGFWNPFRVRRSLWRVNPGYRETRNPGLSYATPLA
jgi:hypothetical protein